MPTIRFEQVSKRYEGTPAVVDVSFQVYEGEILVLLGPSGCGKTTTLRLIAGLERPDTGEIYLRDQLVASPRRWLPPEDRRIGMVFQDYALFPHLSVEKNIHFGLKGLSKDDKQRRTKDMLRLVGLTEMEKRMPFALSGGQQQRVALARALAPQPQVILLDEPFSNLDTALRTQVRSEVRDILKAAGITSIFVTHDQEEALSIADRVVVMFDGRIGQIGKPQQVYIRPESRQVAAFVGEANFLPAEATGQTAHSPLGTLKLAEPTRGPVDLLLRPEALGLSVNPNGGEETTSAVVDWVEFYGHDQRIGLVLEDGTPLVARRDASEVYETGQTVAIYVQRPVMAFD